MRQGRQPQIIDRSRDQDFMREALALAAQGAALGEVPVGAVLVQDDRLLVMAHNAPISGVDATAHAEMTVIREACRMSGNYRLTGARLYVTLEPCLMCAGAILQARIGRVVFGAWDDKAGAAGSMYDLLRDRRLPYRAEVVGGVAEEPARALLRAFFDARR